jgi:hypothetical protein
VSVEAISWALNLAPVSAGGRWVIRPCDPDVVAARITRADRLVSGSPVARPVGLPARGWPGLAAALGVS